MRHISVAALAAAQLVLAGSTLAQTTGAASSQSSLQDRFNAATQAWEKDDCATALPLFEALAHDPRVKPGTLPAAAIAVRRGDCLVRNGRNDEGEASLLNGLPTLRTGGTQFVPDVAHAELQLGMLAMNRWDHDAALSHLRASLQLQQGPQRGFTLMRIALLTAFDGGTEALNAVAEGQKLSEKSAKPDKKALAQWHTMRGRILLNQGRVKEGRAELTSALNLAGGLTSTVSLGDAVMRADLAQGAMLDHQTDDAYRFMAMSGAGRIEKSPFMVAADMDPPECGPDTGLEPQNSAVVEFSIGEDGRVETAQPVYSNSGYAKATAFARAVAKWHWRPEDATKVPLFYRSATRVELRCTNASGSGGASVWAPLWERFAGWASKTLAVPFSEAKRASDWPQWLQLAETAQKAGDPATELAARAVLAQRDLRGQAEVLASIDRGIALATSQDKLPQDSRNAARVLLAANRSEFVRDFGKHADPTAYARQVDTALLALAEDTQIAQDALAQDTALLMSTPKRPTDADASRATATVTRVAEDARLPERYPIRQFAQLRLANDAARQGNLAQAQKWFSATGLSQEQCALIGPKPALTKVSNGGSSFPTKALLWGFEGWVRTEFDIEASGRTAAIRPVIAYPPFIFGEAATGMMTTARYQSSFRPENGAACSANLETIRFMIPGNANTPKVVKKKS